MKKDQDKARALRNLLVSDTNDAFLLFTTYASDGEESVELGWRRNIKKKKEKQSVTK